MKSSSSSPSSSSPSSSSPSSSSPSSSDGAGGFGDNAIHAGSRDGGFGDNAIHAGSRDGGCGDNAIHGGSRDGGFGDNAIHGGSRDGGLNDNAVHGGSRDGGFPAVSDRADAVSPSGPLLGRRRRRRRRPIPPKLYRTGEVVEYSGVSRQTIHNYTTMGLLREARWTHGGHRLYDESVFERLDLIAELKERGSSLHDIREHFSRLDGGP